ncbi:type II toxin-antitoxin system RelE/ParE family toxin [Aminivibrio sp.]|jgi:toxin ParE1/3/4|uniref:type II toxin-antitoxin system RelE/ParE family toxin n=1 Tax=Aminivibrio sp. TaxID=1872489 RepID=UPI001A42EAE0|nr:type II toxin-antitoxin system RelE/ParE family toxin [Aminivibrio sp.]MBL3539462.1 type II toxin-antitoxin system RelE/ParE family toxin [Aminivibrio sp.]
MIYEVLLTEDASQDLGEICQFIASHDDPAKAEYVLAQIESVFERLAVFPFRGATPVELLDLGLSDYREVFFKPYRVFYTVIDNRVYVVAIVDGRRDLRSYLYRRILGKRCLW